MVSDNQKNLLQEPEEFYYLTLHEITRSFGVSAATIIEIVEEGIISLPAEKQEQWVFDRQAINRIRTVLHLHKDLGINYPGAALVIELLDEIERLRHEH